MLIFFLNLGFTAYAEHYDSRCLGDTVRLNYLYDSLSIEVKTELRKALLIDLGFQFDSSRSIYQKLVESEVTFAKYRLAKHSVYLSKNEKYALNLVDECIKVCDTISEFFSLKSQIYFSMDSIEKAILYLDSAKSLFSLCPLNQNLIYARKATYYLKNHNIDSAFYNSVRLSFGTPHLFRECFYGELAHIIRSDKDLFWKIIEKKEQVIQNKSEFMFELPQSHYSYGSDNESSKKAFILWEVFFDEIRIKIEDQLETEQLYRN